MSGGRRTAAIMQPTWLPYLGYFQLIAASDVFVFLDDVQFARRSWQSRNRILRGGREHLLTASVRKAPREAAICDILLDEATPWRSQHLAILREAYATAPCFEAGYAFLESHYARQVGGRLADLSIGLVQDAARRMGLTAQFVRATGLGCGGARSEHLLAICRAVGASDYLSPTGSADYMAEEQVFAAAEFPVEFRSLAVREYPQTHKGDFIPFMSFLDALMNVGWDGLADLVAP